MDAVGEPLFGLCHRHEPRQRSAVLREARDAQVSLPDDVAVVEIELWDIYRDEPRLEYRVIRPADLPAYLALNGVNGAKVRERT